MVDDAAPPSLLGHIRVLDLTEERAPNCAKLLGDLGADVIKLERPGGDPARKLGPFYRDEVDDEKSLYWWAYNVNKRGITLDLGTADGRELFLRLVDTADVVVESFEPGTLEAWRLGWEALHARHPGLILTSISAFGQTGPYAHYKAPEMVVFAMGGMQYLNGEPDRPPLRITFPQSYLVAGGHGLSATMMALYHRGSGGEGQWVDVSAQLGIELTTLNASAFPLPDFYNFSLPRTGMSRQVAPNISTRVVFPCQDGYLTLLILGGFVGAPFMRRMVQWMAEDGMAPPEMAQRDWAAWDYAKLNERGADGQAEMTWVEDRLAEFFLTKTKAELLEGAIQRKLLLGPINDARDIVESPQLAARGYFVPIEHPELGTTVRYPGAFVQMSETPITFRYRPPLIGEHNLAIFEGELGLSRAQLTTLKQAGII